MPALADADGDSAPLPEGAAAEAGALAEGDAVPPQAPATNIAAASMVKIRLRIKSPPPGSGTTTWPSRVGSRGVDARQALRWDRRTESHRAMRASQAVTHIGRNNADAADRCQFAASGHDWSQAALPARLIVASASEPRPRASRSLRHTHGGRTDDRFRRPRPARRP